MSGDEVAKQISSTLAGQYGRPPQKVTCPELKAEVGTKIVCQLTDLGKVYDVAVTATSVDDGRVKFGIAVGTTPVGTSPTTAVAAPTATRPTADATPTARANAVTLRGVDVATQVTTK